MCSRNHTGAGGSVSGVGKQEQDLDLELDLKMDLKMDLEDRHEWQEHPVDPEPVNELQKKIDMNIKPTKKN